MDSSSLTVSAPGKVLIVGGYLVLERPNPGLVIGVSSRFYSTLRWKISEDSSSSGTDTDEKTQAQRALVNRDYAAVLEWYSRHGNTQQGGLPLAVVSPQFGTSSNFVIHAAKPRVVRPDEKNGKSNPFVQRALELVLLYLSSTDPSNFPRILAAAIELGAGLELTLLADNDFYSQLEILESRSLPITRESLSQLPKCQECPRDNHGQAIVSKTGLGSSAALTTSVIASALCFLEVSAGGDCISGDNVHVIHRLAQVAHGLAQGKVGSGFDVCAACYGSVRYIRISEENLRHAMEDVESGLQEEAKYDGCAGCLSASESALWDHDIESFHLPQGVDILLADVCGGSETPSMVRKILQWKRSHLEATGQNPPLWQTLTQVNVDIDKLVKMLNCCAEGRAVALEFQEHVDEGKEYSSENYAAAVLELSHLKRDQLVPVSSQWEQASKNSRNGVLGVLASLAKKFEEARHALKAMGESADVPVEPEAQTQLIDHTLNVPGVVAAGVPGAGGYDALFSIVLDPSSLSHANNPQPGDVTDVKRNVEETWTSWKAVRPCPLLLHAAGSRLTGYASTREGVRVDSAPR